ncbi:hypothetical protein [Tenuifilum osseticum]|uniref:hypothetical protein n=1 Tax=Tenuifilum osseticum TaxID=3374723 RepID=UPI0034E48C5D
MGLIKKKKSDDSQVEDADPVEYSQPISSTVKPTATPKAIPTTPKTPVRTTSIKGALSGAPNNADIKNNDEPKVEEIQTENQGIASVEIKRISHEQVLQAWTSFAEQIQKVKPAHFSLMQVYKPILKENNKIIIQFEGQIQIELFSEIKKDLLTYIKKSFGILNIEIAEEIVEKIEDNGKPRLYTPEDKFRFMAERNPALIRLKQQLNLDLD